MFISFTYKCPDCGHTEDRLVDRAEMDTQTCPHFDEPPLMVRLPAGTRTTFRFADESLKR